MWVVVVLDIFAACIFPVFAMPDFYSAWEDCQCGKNTPMVSQICWGVKKPLTSLKTQACS
jgi:hypothetical protein